MPLADEVGEEVSRVFREELAERTVESEAVLSFGDHGLLRVAHEGEV